ncbi:MAG: hypothetical protein ACR2OJ_06440 [Hyphomicrobiales bacterium]
MTQIDKHNTSAKYSPVSSKNYQRPGQVTGTNDVKKVSPGLNEVLSLLNTLDTAA